MLEKFIDKITDMGFVYNQQYTVTFKHIHGVRTLLYHLHHDDKFYEINIIPNVLTIHPHKSTPIDPYITNDPGILPDSCFYWRGYPNRKSYQWSLVDSEDKLNEELNKIKNCTINIIRDKKLNSLCQ